MGESVTARRRSRLLRWFAGRSVARETKRKACEGLDSKTGSALTSHPATPFFREREKGDQTLAHHTTMSGNSRDRSVAFDVPESVRDDGPDNGLDGDVDPALDLVRTMSMSTDKDILKQLRDAMNPKQKQQTFIMVLQAGLGLVAVAILLAVVIVGYILLVNVGNAVKTMADQTTELKIITQQTSEAMSQLVDNLAPAQVLPEFKEILENMNEGVDTLTTTLCGSPLFAAQCPAELRGGAFVPGLPSTTPAPAPAPATDTADTSAGDEISNTTATPDTGGKK